MIDMLECAHAIVRATSKRIEAFQQIPELREDTKKDLGGLAAQILGLPKVRNP